MIRTCSIALLACLCLASMATADDKPSPAVKRILDKAVTEVRKNLQEFGKANETPLREARKDLEEISTKLIKDGKAEEAGVVLKQVGTLEADVMKMAKAPAPVGGGGGKVAPQKPLLERLVGKWQRQGYEYAIGADGVIRASDGDGGKLVLVSPEIAEVIWRTGTKTQYLIAHDDIACGVVLHRDGSRKQIYVLERIK